MEEKKERSLANRLICYFSGLFIMTLGISVSVKSNLGVSPVSSLPYTLTCCFGIEMGKATIMLHIALVILQIIILRKNFRKKDLLQIPVGIVFGYFTTFCNFLTDIVETPENIAVRLIMIIFSTVLIALGIFFYLPADIVPLAGEGMTKTISDVTNKPLSQIKVAFDIILVAVSAVLCLAVLHNVSSVGVGTIIAAALVGTFLGLIKKIYEKIGNAGQNHKKISQ